MSDHITSLRWLGNHIDADAANQGIGQGSEGARICWNAAIEIESLRQQLAERDAELKRINLAINDDRVDLTITAAEAITELWQQVAELTLSSDTYFIERNSARDAWRRVSKERDELRQQVTLLREAMQGAWKDGYCFVGPEGQTDEQKAFEQALTTTADLDGLILCDATPIRYLYRYQDAGGQTVWVSDTAWQGMSPLETMPLYRTKEQ